MLLPSKLLSTMPCRSKPSSTFYAQILTIACLSSGFVAVSCGNPSNNDISSPPLFQNRSFEHWLAQLEDDDVEYRGVAIEALGQMGVAATPAAPRLEEELENSAAHIRCKAAAALGAIGPSAKSAVPRLISLLHKERNLDSHRNVFRALLSIGPDGIAAVEHELDSWSSEDPRKPWSGEPRLPIELLGLLGPKGKFAVPYLEKRLERSILVPHSETDLQFLNCEWSLLKVLAQLGPENLVLLEKVAQSKDAYTRRAALEAIGMMGQKAKSAAKTAQLGAQDKDKRVRAIAHWAMRAIDTDAISALRQSIESQESEETYPALLQLTADIGPPAKVVIPSLAALLKRTTSRGRYQIVLTLGAIAPENTAALREWLRDKDPEVRKAAAVTLCWQLESFDEVASQLDENLYSHLQIFSEQKHCMPHAKMRPVLEKMLQAANHGQRCYAARQLSYLGEPAIPALLKAMQDKDTAVQQTAALALRRIGPAAVPGLEKLLESDDSTLRDLAAQTLGDMGRKAKGAVPTLEKIVAKNCRDRVPMQYIYALGKLDPMGPWREKAKQVGRLSKLTAIRFLPGGAPSTPSLNSRQFELASGNSSTAGGSRTL